MHLSPSLESDVLSTCSHVTVKMRLWPEECVGEVVDTVSDTKPGFKDPRPRETDGGLPATRVY